MRLIGRHDVFLLGGLAIALFVLFSGFLERVLALAHDIDQTRGLQLLPALVILAAVFIFHQQRKRHEIRAVAAAAAQDAQRATARAAELERLVAFGQALARSLDFDSIRSAAAQHLPRLADGRPVWAMVRSGSRWEALTASSSPDAAPSPAAHRALGDVAPLIGSDTGDLAFPMMVAGEPIGAIGVEPDPPLTDNQRFVFAAAAALLAVSLKNAELFREVRENSVRDALTGCVNRNHAMEVLEAELRRVRRSNLALSVVMFDLDHFKDINDRFGHLCGDAVLAAVGQRMNAELRGSDVKCRYGGEEFLMLLPDTPLAGAQRVADTLRRTFAAHPVTWRDDVVPVTASFGLTAVVPGEIDALAVIGRADAALYRAKQDGRNCVRTAELQEVTA